MKFEPTAEPTSSLVGVRPLSRAPAASHVNEKPRERLQIPAILQEGDRPAPTPISGPGKRYELAPGRGPETPDSPPAELPEAYGTERLWLAARDPHWLYACWDLTRDQLRHYNSLARDRHLALRVYGPSETAAAGEVQVHPESRNWFVHVEQGGARYSVELGYYSPAGAWVGIATSKSVNTPADAPDDEEAIRFSTIPVEVPFEQLLSLAREAVRKDISFEQARQERPENGSVPRAGFEVSPADGSLAQPPEGGIPSRTAQISEPAPAVSEIKTAPPAPENADQEPAVNRRTNLPSIEAAAKTPSPPKAPGWSPEQTAALAELLSAAQAPMNSGGSSLELAQFPVGSPGGLASEGLGQAPGISSLESGGVRTEAARHFWFNVHAELIVYGATEPDAAVYFGGHRIGLRADGTFSQRMALPDGRHALVAAAISGDKVESRQIELEVTRQTREHPPVLDPAANPVGVPLPAS